MKANHKQTAVKRNRKQKWHSHMVQVVTEYGK